MNNGQRVAAILVDLATPTGRIHETTTNDDGPRGWIRDSQRFWGMGSGTSIGPQPWCGMGQDKGFRLAKVDDHGICHPSTAEMCRRADRMGGLSPKSSVIHPGTILIQSGVHTTTVVHDRNDGSGLVDCVGCNESDMVRRSVRAKSWGRFIEVPGLRDGEPVPLVEYWFEDVASAPLFWEYASKQVREDKIAADFKKLDEAKLIRRVRAGKRYGFFLYSGQPYRWGPWVGKKDGPVKKRRDDLKRVKENELGHGLRARSRPVAVTPDMDFSGSGGETTTSTT